MARRGAPRTLLTDSLRPGPGNGRLLATGAAAGVAGAAAIVIGAAAAGWSSDVMLVLGVSVGVGVVVAVVQRVSASVTLTPWPRHGADDGDRYVPEDRVTFLERRLEFSVGDARIFSARVQPAMRDVIARAAAHHHGIDLDVDHRAGGRLVGEDVWAFVTEPPRRPPTAAELTEAISRIERLCAGG